jgi:hypothetical protein
MALTSVDALLRQGNLKIGKCRNFNFSVDKDPLNTTRMGDFDRSTITGLRGASGTFTLFYDPSDQGVRAVINNILSDTTAPMSDFNLVFNKKADTKISCSIVILQMSASVDYGSAQVCEVSYRVSGAMSGQF